MIVEAGVRLDHPTSYHSKASNNAAEWVKKRLDSQSLNNSPAF